jgi:hypothetical protein
MSQGRRPSISNNLQGSSDDVHMPQATLQSCLLTNRGHRQEGESGDSKCKSCMRRVQMLPLASELIVLPRRYSIAARTWSSGSVANVVA